MASFDNRLVTNDVIADLQRELGPKGVLVGDDVSNRSAGWGRKDGCAARAIVRPQNTEEVAAVLRICHAADQPIVPQGGLTGLVEGALAGENEIVLSLERMNQIEELDETSRTMTVQAGVLLQTAQERVETVGLMLPLDLGARGSATVGGNVATNAGGNRVIRYGMMRDMVLGLEAVLADGTVITSLNKFIKNNAGYDLRHLFIGSEGTLGVVTRIVLRLRQLPRSQNTAFVGVTDFDKLTVLLKTLDGALGGTLSAFEVMWNNFYRLVTTAPAKNSPPLPHDYPYYVLVEALGADQQADSSRFELALMDCIEQELAADAVIAKSQAECDAMWTMRDDVEQVFRFAPIFGYDVSLAIQDMENYVAEVQETLQQSWPEHHTFIFGHLGDGNLHVVVAVGSNDQAVRRQVEQIVYGALKQRQGSISAEHGIGLEKRAYLTITRSDAEVALMRTLKQSLDPKGILNPGKILAPA